MMVFHMAHSWPHSFSRTVGYKGHMPQILNSSIRIQQHLMWSIHFQIILFSGFFYFVFAFIMLPSRPWSLLLTDICPIYDFRYPLSLIIFFYILLNKVRSNEHSSSGWD